MRSLDRLISLNIQTTEVVKIKIELYYCLQLGSYKNNIRDDEEI